MQPPHLKMCVVFKVKSKTYLVLCPKYVSISYNCLYSSHHSCRGDTVAQWLALLPPSRRITLEHWMVIFAKHPPPQHFHPPAHRGRLTMLADVSVVCFTALIVPVKGTRCLQLHTVSKAGQRERRRRSKELFQSSSFCNFV